MTLFLTFLLGCSPHTDAPLQSIANLPPHMPAPQRDTYTRQVSQPLDPLLAAATQDIHWILSLSGAAGKIALDYAAGHPLPSRSTLRERVWRAGYPYPVLETKVWAVAEKQPLPQALKTWLSKHPGDDFGIARARLHQRDVWIGLRAAPATVLPPLPKTRTLGQTFPLSAIPNATLSLVDPNGARRHVDLTEAPPPVKLNQSGEWFFQFDTTQHTFAKFPIYVDIAPPELGAIESLESGEGGLDDRLNALRDLYGLLPWLRDPMLDHGASALALSPQPSVKAVDVFGEDLTLWTCPTDEIDPCLDRWLWTAETRSLFLSGQPYYLGLYHDPNAQKNKWWLLLSQIKTGD